VGTGASAWASRLTLSEGARLVYGFLDGALALLCLTGQAFLNSLFGIGIDASVENYLSLSFLWYLCLRSALMVSMNALAFQSVPALALFGLIATYMLATQVLWLFVLMLLAVLFLMLASHWLEWGRAKLSLETGYALRTVCASGMVAGLVAFLATPILALTIGRAISTIVVGVPFRGNLRATPSETPPELQVGAGAVELSEMEVLRVRLEGEAQPKYLRMESYSHYTGRGWNRGRVFFEEMISLGQGKFVPQRAFDAPESHQATATCNSPQAGIASFTRLAIRWRWRRLCANCTMCAGSDRSEATVRWAQASATPSAPTTHPKTRGFCANHRPLDGDTRSSYRPIPTSPAMTGSARGYTS
jgi:hypothetical protein